MPQANRHREQLKETSAAAWQAQHEIVHLRRKLSAAETRITALENIIVKHLNIVREVLQEELDKVTEEHTAQQKAADCPQCGRPLQEHTRACIYCGHVS